MGAEWSGSDRGGEGSRARQARGEPMHWIHGEDEAMSEMKQIEVRCGQCGEFNPVPDDVQETVERHATLVEAVRNLRACLGNVTMTVDGWDALSAVDALLAAEPEASRG
jgi:hypothetical protein